MSKRIPKRLKKEPLLEAIWEIRFASDRGHPIGDLLPGMIFQKMRSDFPAWVRLPVANIPHPVAEQDENLRYLPTVRLEGPETPFAIQMGERIVTLNCQRPYAGWDAFSNRIRELADLLLATGLIRPERFSLKYIDLLELDVPPSLASLEVSLKVGEYLLDNRPMQLRAEIQEEPFTHILQLATPVDVTLGEGGERLHGTLVQIDTIHLAAEDFWDTLEERLKRAHDLSKQVFFSLLTEQAISKLEPEYE